MKSDHIKLGSYTWYNIQNINQKRLAHIHNKFKIEHVHLKMALPKRQRPKFIKRKDYIFLILQYPVQKNKNINSVEFEELDVFIGKDFIISIHNDLKSISNLFNILKKDFTILEKKFKNNPTKLIHDFIIDSTDTCWAIIDNLADELDELKNKIFDTHDKKVITRILTIKSTIADIRKNMQFQKGILKRLKFQTSEFFKEEDAYPKFDRLIDVSQDLWTYLDAYNDNIDAIQESFEASFSFHLNNIIKTLTVFSVILLPLTLFTGIMGMNNLPYFYSNPALFWPLLSGILFFIFSIFIFFKFKRWV